MKKFIALAALLSVALFAFVGCTNGNGDFKDGSYRAEYESADEHGWTDALDVTVSDGKITSAVFDSYDAEGNKKSENADYNAAMTGAGYETPPSEFLPHYSSELVAQQDAEKVDAITGATVSNDALKKFYKELAKNMRSGNTETVKISR